MTENEKLYIWCAVSRDGERWVVARDIESAARLADESSKFRITELKFVGEVAAMDGSE